MKKDSSVPFHCESCSTALAYLQHVQAYYQTSKERLTALVEYTMRQKSV